MAVAARIGHFQSRVILVVLYFVVGGPIAMVLRLHGDPLGVKGTGSTWTERRRAASLEASRRQF
jgi:hypothetical protein